jgi:hypothetical protein
MTTASCYSFCNVLLKDGFKVRCLDGVPVCCMFFITCCLACVVSGQWSVECQWVLVQVVSVPTPPVGDAFFEISKLSRNLYGAQ